MKARGAHEDRVSRLSVLNNGLLKAEHQTHVFDVALKMMESLVLRAQSIVHERIDRIVSAALQTVYQDGAIQFKTVLERTGDRMEATFAFVYGDDPMPGPVMDTVGGGMVDVASFTLRLSIARILNVRGIIALDEPFRHIDADALPRMVTFAHRLCHDFGRQLLIISHDPVTRVAADNVIHVVGRGQIAKT